MQYQLDYTDHEGVGSTLEVVDEESFANRYSELQQTSKRIVVSRRETDDDDWEQFAESTIGSPTAPPREMTPVEERILQLREQREREAGAPPTVV